MELRVRATSCCGGSWAIVEKYGDKLAQFGATCNGESIKEVEVPSHDDEDAFYSDPVVKVNFTSLEVLRDFIGTFGSVVMGTSYIEIYDDYRE